MTLRLGTRGSALALWQTRHVAGRLAHQHPAWPVELVEIVSTGDRVTDVPLSAVEGTGFFTAALERALLAGEVDVAVHSCKDLPVADTPGLTLAAVLARGPVEDVLVARDGFTLAALPPGARVGTCSLRRTAQLRARRPDLTFVPLRGNVPTRVDRVRRGELDAVVLARAGLVRLGLDEVITEIFPVAEILPAPAQGAMAVQCRSGDAGTLERLAPLDDPDTRRAVAAERRVMHALGGGCSVPVGALALCKGPHTLALDAAVFALDGTRAVRVREQGADAAAADKAARRLLEMGAAGILAAADKAARLEPSLSSGAWS